MTLVNVFHNRECTTQSRDGSISYFFRVSLVTLQMPGVVELHKS
jgi:hypothetical protein